MENYEENNEEKNENTALVGIHDEALQHFNNVQSALRDERKQCLEDRRFYSIAGAQWEGRLGEQFENRPRLEVNKIHLSVIRIINEYRRNRITVDFKSKDGSDMSALSETCDGLYRSDEQDSVADEAYDNGFEEAVAGGIGAWRLRADYENEYDDEDDYQRVKIEPIFDADTSVYFDLNAKRQDKSDAKWCFVITSMTVQSYKAEFGDDPASWDKTVSDREFDWNTQDVVYVAEYYKIEEHTEKITIFTSLLEGEEKRIKESEFKEDPELRSKILSQGYAEDRTRKVKRKKVHKYILSGNKILEDCGCIAGTEIPIVMVYGKRWFVDNIERAMGHVRLSKDPQRLKNMQLSKLAELSALSSTEKPIVTPEQIAGHEQMWTDDNIKEFPYLLLNPIEDADGNTMASPPIGYTRNPQIAPALAALLQLTDQDMRDILGNPEAGEKIAANISGDAISQIQDRIDMQTYIYMSNMAKAMKRSGEIWLSISKDIYVEENRTMKTINEAGDTKSVILSQAGIGEDGGVESKNDLSKAKFEVFADVGPASSTRKQATVKALTEMMRVVTDPQDLKVLSSMIMLNMEGEGVDDLRGYYRNQLIRIGAVEPTEEEAQQLAAEAANAKPSAEENFLNAEATKSEAQAQKAHADIVLNVAKTEETQAKTVEILAGVDRDDREQLMESVEKINQAVKEGQTQESINAE